VSPGYPVPEQVHWLFGAGFLLLGLCLISELIVGHELWARRLWRAYLLPGLLFGLGLMLWPLAVRSASSTIHLIAHSTWAAMVTLAGVAELGRERAKLRVKIWEFGVPFALFVSGLAFLAHENRGFWFSRAAFLHYIIGWVMVGGGLFYGLYVARPHWRALRPTVALSVVIVAVLLFCIRDVAAIFGHLSPNAGPQHR
jgi:hypothetical protein